MTCPCASCKVTDEAEGRAKWPSGPIAGKRNAILIYNAHVARSLFAEAERAKNARRIDPNPISFYGVPKGMTRQQVLASLAASFAPSAHVSVDSPTTKGKA